MEETLPIMKIWPRRSGRSRPSARRTHLEMWARQRTCRCSGSPGTPVCAQACCSGAKVLNWRAACENDGLPEQAARAAHHSSMSVTPHRFLRAGMYGRFPNSSGCARCTPVPSLNDVDFGGDRRGECVRYDG